VSNPLRSRFSAEVKVRIVQRVESGERISVVAAEMGVLRKSIYEWRTAYRALGAAGLDRRRGPKPGGRRKSASAGDVAPSGAPSEATSPAETKPADRLALADARIAELERVIGRQQADLHFFREALRPWDTNGPKADAPTSTRSSKK
jgi:transposase